MTSWLILAVAVIYLAVGIGYVASGQYWHALTWVSYALANVGLYKMG